MTWSAAADACRQSLIIDDAFVREVRYADLSFDGRLSHLAWRSADGEGFVPPAECVNGDFDCAAGNADLRRQAQNIAEVRFEIRHWFSDARDAEFPLVVDFSLDGPCARRPLVVGEEYIVTITRISSAQQAQINVHRSSEWPVAAGQLLATQREVLRDRGLYR